MRSRIARVMIVALVMCGDSAVLAQATITVYGDSVTQSMLCDTDLNTGEMYDPYGNPLQQNPNPPRCRPPSGGEEKYFRCETGDTRSGLWPPAHGTQPTTGYYRRPNGSIVNVILDAYPGLGGQPFNVTRVWVCGATDLPH